MSRVAGLRRAQSSRHESQLFDIYLKELIEWNRKFNLTSITDPTEIKKKHFDDSLLLLQIFQLTNESVVDIGAGAGFPGVPLKIACPEIKLTLIDSVRKKIEFLNHLIKTLGLKDAAAIWSRAEDYAGKNRERFDLAISRAVASLNILCEYCLPLVRVGGTYVAYKEESISSEIEEAKNAMSELGGELVEVKRFPRRALVVIKKAHPTPPQYPRRPGLAKKRPL